MNDSITDQLSHSTVRIQTDKGSGTGFFYRLDTKSNNIPILAIVTNKHVLEDCTIINFKITRADIEGNPIYDTHRSFEINNIQNICVYHPDNDVDLCAIPINSLLEKQPSRKVFYRAIDSSLVPDKAILESLQYVEDIIMVGYPDSIWDEKNNLPLFRKGITSSHPKNNWNGMPVVVIDSACFPGSSGSPVFIYNTNGYSDTKGNTIIGSRLLFIGILYATYTHTITGDIGIVKIPLNNKQVSISNIPNNLGLIIKSECLIELENEILKNI